MIVYLLDTLIGDGTDANPYRPAIGDAGILQPGNSLSDAPTEPQYIPYPNMVIVEIRDGDAMIAAIEAHPDYGPGSILMDIPNPYPGDGKPDVNEFGARRSYCAKLGISQQRFIALFGSQSNPKTRRESLESIQSWVQTLPKGNK